MEEHVQLAFDLGQEYTPGPHFAQTSAPSELYLLLNLRPKYFYNIKDGSKTYEYRRRFVGRASITFLYLGTTPPDPLSSSIPAYVRLGAPVIAPPAQIGELAERQRPGSSPSILEYMHGLDHGYAMPIQAVEELKQIIHLKELREHFPTFVPPQSYMVLNNHPSLLQFLLQRAPCLRVPD